MCQGSYKQNKLDNVLGRPITTNVLLLNSRIHARLTPSHTAKS